MKNILVVCDSPWHPAEVIEMGLAPLEGLDYHFTFVKTAKDILTPEFIAGFPLIICAKGNQVTEANPEPWFEDTVTEVGPAEFRTYIENGGGFIALHAATTCKAGTPMGDLVGCTFHGHPLRCGVDVQITAEHPITKGVAKDFTIRDEHYQITLDAPDAQVLFHTRSAPGGDQVAGYTREMGQGRMCVLTPGHTLSVFHNKEFQKLLVNAAQWCMGIA